MSDYKQIRICTWTSDAQPLVIGELVMDELGMLQGRIVSQELVDRILQGRAGDFVLTPEEYLPEKEVLETVDEAWGGKRERAWLIASSLVGPVIVENGGIGSASAQLDQIMHVANWLLEEL